MAALPPNVKEERRLEENAGSRVLFRELTAHEERSEKRFELFSEDINKRIDGLVSYKALFAAVVTAAITMVGGVLAMASSTRAQVDVAKAAMETRIDGVDKSLQAFKAETGAEVKGMYRFLLEKQRPEVVRQDVERQKREEAPPPVPINPLAPKGRR